MSLYQYGLGWVGLEPFDGVVSSTLGRQQGGLRALASGRSCSAFNVFCLFPEFGPGVSPVLRYQTLPCSSATHAGSYRELAPNGKQRLAPLARKWSSAHGIQERVGDGI